MHAKFNLENFAIRHWKSMENAMFLALKSDFYESQKLNDDEKIIALNAWRKVIGYVIEKTKFGFEAEKKLCRRFSEPKQKRKFDFKNFFCTYDTDALF